MVVKQASEPSHQEVGNMLLNATLLAASSASTLLQTVSNNSPALPIIGRNNNQIASDFQTNNNTFLNINHSNPFNVYHDHSDLLEGHLNRAELNYGTAQSLLLKSHLKGASPESMMITKSAEGYYVFNNITLKVSV